MKKFFLFLTISFFSTEVLAQEYSNQGVLKDFVDEEEEPKYFTNIHPKMVNRVISEVSFNDNYQSTDRKNEYNDTAGRVRFYSNLHLNDQVWLNTYAVAERLDNLGETQRRNALPNGGGDRTFENTGIYLQEFNITNDNKNYQLVAGKFNLNFGNAWRWDRGLWIQNVADNYRQTEKLGFSGVYRVGDPRRVGQYNFGFSTFTNDRKNLDNSILVNRDSSQKYSGAPGDTRGLESYNASLDIHFDFSEKEKLSYHFAYSNLAVNSRTSQVTPTKIADQKSYVANINYKYPVGENFLVDSLIEYSRAKNVGGDSDVGDSYLTANVIFRFHQNWNMLLGNASRKHTEIDLNGFDQNLSEISFGYEFNKTSFFDKLTLQAGYKNQRINYKTSVDTQNVLGFLVRYYKNF